MKECFDTSGRVSIKHDEPSLYKVELKADSYPNGWFRAHKLSSGDVIYITNDNNTVKLGERFKNYPAIVSEICYAPKKWWQFWKPKKQIGYYVRWL